MNFLQKADGFSLSDKVRSSVLREGLRLESPLLQKEMVQAFISWARFSGHVCLTGSRPQCRLGQITSVGWTGKGSMIPQIS